eukprot:7017673-Prymnesium_polylepis.1
MRAGFGPAEGAGGSGQRRICGRASARQKVREGQDSAEYAGGLRPGIRCGRFGKVRPGRPGDRGGDARSGRHGRVGAAAAGARASRRTLEVGDDVDRTLQVLQPVANLRVAQQHAHLWRGLLGGEEHDLGSQQPCGMRQRQSEWQQRWRERAWGAGAVALASRGLA